MECARSRRALSPMLATLIIISIVVFAGVMLFLMTSSFFKGGSRASLTVSGTGTASPDGSSATIQLTLQNSGDVVARVAAIYVAPETRIATVSQVKVPVSGVTGSVLSSDQVPQAGQSMPQQGLDIDAKGTRTILIKLSGSGLYSGARLHVYVVYYDVNTGKGYVADTIVTLR